MGSYRLDQGHARTAGGPPVAPPPPAGPRVRFGRINPPAPVYRVWAAKWGGDEPASAVVLHECGSLKTALAIAAGESLSADLGDDVTDVLVTTPGGEQLVRYPVPARGVV